MANMFSHGMLVSTSGDGHYYRVFEPCWFKPWRWIAYWLRARVYGTAKIVAYGTNGEIVQLRVVGVPRPRD